MGYYKENLLTFINKFVPIFLFSSIETKSCAIIQKKGRESSCNISSEKKKKAVIFGLLLIFFFFVLSVHIVNLLILFFESLNEKIRMYMRSHSQTSRIYHVCFTHECE